jgi:hypothetical protein
MSSEAIDVCAKLQLKIENSEYTMFPLRQNLFKVRKALELAKLNWITSGKTDEAKKIVHEVKAAMLHLQAIKDRCDEIIRYTDNCVELMEIEFPGIVSNSRKCYEELILRANRPIERIVGELLENCWRIVGELLENCWIIVGELLVAHGVSEVLSHDGETPEGYRYPNPFAHPDLEQFFCLSTTEGST